MTTGEKDRPLDSNEVVIADSGVLSLKTPFLVNQTDAVDIDLTDLQPESFPADDEDDEEEEEEDSEEYYNDGEEETIEGPIRDNEEGEKEGKEEEEEETKHAEL